MLGGVADMDCERLVADGFAVVVQVQWWCEYHRISVCCVGAMHIRPGLKQAKCAVRFVSCCESGAISQSLHRRFRNDRQIPVMSRQV